PVALEDDLAAELRREIIALEDAFVDIPGRAVLQATLLPAFKCVALTAHGRDDDELRRDASRFGEKPLPLLRFEVAVEVAREDPLEGTVAERKGERVALDERRRWRLASRDLEHPFARVERDHLTAQMPG